jgi:hypothetical protein
MVVLEFSKPTCGSRVSFWAIAALPNATSRRLVNAAVLITKSFSGEKLGKFWPAKKFYT